VQREIKKAQDNASDVHALQTQLPWHAALVLSLTITGRVRTLLIMLSQDEAMEVMEGRGRCGVRVEVGPVVSF
jgi:hypothetical protein